MNELQFPFSFTCKDDKTGVVYTAAQAFNGDVIIYWVYDDNYTHNFGSVKTFKEKFEGLGETTIITTDPDVTVKQSELDNYIDEINMLRELVAEITLQTDFSSLEQQAEVFRDLNDKMIKHQSFVGSDGSRRDELLKQLDVLFEAYDSVVYNADKESECKFKPISEMTLDDWKQAQREKWVFSIHYMGDVTVYDVGMQPQDLFTVLVENAVGNTWYIGIDGTDIDEEGWTVVQRIK